ncbi:hypothetical protein [Janibacter sp. GXQ6167]|uniref:hypothetical protein n=1 Tax=Janibacter sp. GXQ6167 TaxID=3240791 RepID=UPI00352684E2
MSDPWTAPGSQPQDPTRPWEGSEPSPPTDPAPTPFPGNAPIPPGDGGAPPADPGPPPSAPPFTGHSGMPSHPGTPDPAGPFSGSPPPHAPPGWGAASFQPGIVPLRALRLGDIYSGVFKAVRGNAGATIGLSFVVNLVVLVPLVALAAYLASQTTISGDWLSESPESSAAFTSVDLINQIPTLGSIIVTALLAVFLARVILVAVTGRKTTIAEVWAATSSRILPAIGATALTFVGSLLLIALLLGPGIALLVAADGDGGSIGLGVLALLAGALVLFVLYLWLWTRLAFVTSAISIERVGVFRGFSRSWSLTSGKEMWRILGIRLLTSLVISMVVSVITLPLALVAIGAFAFGSGDPSTFAIGLVVTTGIASVVAGALTAPFTSGVDALLYIDERFRREAFDVRIIDATQRGSDLTADGVDLGPPADAIR